MLIGEPVHTVAAIVDPGPHCLNKTVTQRKWLPHIQCYRTSVAQGLLADPATKFEIADNVVGRTCCNASANPICAFLMPAIRLIDTRLASHRGHYVKSLVRESPRKASIDFCYHHANAPIPMVRRLRPVLRTNDVVRWSSNHLRQLLHERSQICYRVRPVLPHEQEPHVFDRPVRGALHGIGVRGTLPLVVVQLGF